MSGDDVAREVERLTRRVAELERLDGLRRELRRLEDVEAIAGRVREHVTEETRARACAVLLEDRGLGTWAVVAASEAGLPDIQIERSDALLARLEGVTLVAIDPAADGDLAALAPLGTDLVLLPLADATATTVGLLVASGIDATRRPLLEEIAAELAHSVGSALRDRARAEEIAMLAVQERELVGLLRDVEERDSMIRADLEQASAFQHLMLGALPRVPRLRVETMYEPLGLVGGDLYAFSEHEKVLRVFIADATGHGIRASLTTMLVKNSYESVTHDAENPAVLLERLNNAIARYRTPEMLFTAACIDIEPETGEVRFSSAAHPPACIVTADQQIQTLEGGVSALMGLSPGMHFPLTSGRLGDGDSVFLYTDGIVDTHNEQGELFGEGELFATIRRALGGGESVVDAVRDAMKRFAGKRELTDDATLVAISRGPYEAPPVSLR